MVLPKNIAHLESHHLAEHNEAAHTPLDPPRRVSMIFSSLSRFCNRRNSFLKEQKRKTKKTFRKPAPEGVVRVGISVWKSTVWESTVSGNPFWIWEPTHWTGSLQSGSLQISGYQLGIWKCTHWTGSLQSGSLQISHH